MAHYGAVAAAFGEEHRNLVRPFLAERERITDDPSYSSGERSRALAPINSQALASFADTGAKIESVVQRAEAEHVRMRTSAQHLRAAYDSPSHAVALKQLGESAGPNGRASLAMLAAEKNDLAGAFGLKASLGDGEGNTHAVLGSIGSAAAESATADLVLAKKEHAHFIGGGPYGDGPGTNPLAALQAANAISIVPDGNGGQISLSDADVKRYLELAG